MSRRFLRAFPRLARHGLTLAVLAGVAVGTVGMPVAPPDLSRGGAFPCQGHGCGCRSAEQCRFNCCCLTAAQRLAWAEEHGVAPPEGVALIAEEEAEAAKADEPGFCRMSDGKPSCCSGGDRSCCSRKAGPVEVAKRTAKSKPSERPAISCPTCRGGLANWWVAAGQPLALPERPLTVAPPTGSEPVSSLGVTYAFSAARPG